MTSTDPSGTVTRRAAPRSPGPSGPAARRSAAAPFVWMGGVGAVAGGVLAAATAYAPTFHASWATAYLVLVVGVAQVCLGVGQALMAERVPSPRTVMSEFVLFNLGHIGVLLGGVLDTNWLTDIGGVLLLPPLVLMLLSVRRRAAGPRWTVVAYRGLMVVLLVSIPTGLVLARFGPG